MHAVGVLTIIGAGLLGFWAGYRFDSTRGTGLPVPHRYRLV